MKTGVMIECNREEGDFISSEFTSKKKYCNMHTILNLKYINKYVKWNHFKIEWFAGGRCF